MGKMRRVSTLWSAHVLLLLIWAARCHGCIADALARLIGWMVKQCANVVNKQWIKELSDLFFVGEIQSAIERNPKIK